MDNDIPLRSYLGTSVEDLRPTVKDVVGMKVLTDLGLFTDLTSGGHACAFPSVKDDLKKAVVANIDENLLPTSSRFFANSSQLKLSNLVANAFGEPGAKVYFTSGGTEAFEIAISLAYWYQDLTAPRFVGQRRSIIGRNSSYHGMSIHALNAGHHPVHTNRLGVSNQYWPKLPRLDCGCCDIGKRPETCDIACLNRTEILTKSHPAALIYEPICGTTDVSAVPPENYFQKMRDLADATKSVLIADEVITAFRRTGPMFAAQNSGADITIGGKCLASGYAPLCAVVLSEKFANNCRLLGEQLPLRLTFSGNSLAASIGLYLQTITTERFSDDFISANAVYLQQILNSKFQSKNCRIVGRGHLWSLEWMVDNPKKAYSSLMKQALLHKMILMGGIHNSRNCIHITITPPLDAATTEIEQAINELQLVISSTPELEQR